jgi:TonB family protein
MWKRVAQCVFPTYPLLAFQAHITGTVDIGLGISPKGDVANLRVLSGHPIITPSAVDAIRQWKFQPNMVKGEVTWSRVRALARFNDDGTTTIDLARALRADDFGDPGTPVTGPAETMVSSTAAAPRPPAAPVCKSAQPWPGAQATEIEASETGPGRYKNNYFGLTFHFPSEWQVADRAALDSIEANMESAARSQYEYAAMPTNVHFHSLPSYLLFFARTDGPVGSDGPSVRIWAEKEPFLSSSAEYFPNTHFLSDKTAEGTRGPEQVEVGGTKYYRGDRWGKVNGGSVYQVRLVTYTRDLILGIDVIADGAAAAEQLVKSLEGISIRASGATTTAPAEANAAPVAAPASGEAPKQVHVSQGVSLGLLVYKVQPVYPPEAKQAHIQGAVLLRARISKGGRIADLQLISGPKELAPAAIGAVQQWRYRPYLLLGNPVEVDTEIVVNFQLR